MLKETMYKILKYNRELAVDYALKFALQRNPNFFDYTYQGGNCTNYVSQCIYAGAHQMNTSPNGWFYFSPTNTSISWANVEPLYNFLTTNQYDGPFAKYSPLEMCEVGDIIQLKFINKPVFSHALVITKIQTRTPSGIYVCANTRDIKNLPLGSYDYEKSRLVHILGYRTKI